MMNGLFDTGFLKRERDGHKGDYGKVLISAGSKGMMGAAILAARSALRSGAGLLTLSVPVGYFELMHLAVPEAMCVERGREDFGKYDAVAFGCGIGKNAAEYLQTLLTEYDGLLVLDADGLNIMAENRRFLEDFKGKLLITPHEGEAARLLKTTAEKIHAGREEAVKRLASEYRCTAVLKGSGSLVYGESGLYINSTGNPGMATGGSGDCLTGICTALAAACGNMENAARLGVYVHGLAGDIAAQKLGETSLAAGDIIDALPQAFMQLEKQG